MPFEITTPTAATLTSVTPRKEMHGDEPVSAVSLGLTITGPNTLLDHLDGGKLRHALYMAVPDQDELPGVEPATPLLRARGIEVVGLKGTLEGWTVSFEHGIGDDIVLGSSKVDKFRVKPMEGGSVELLFRVGTSDISEEEAGALFGKLGQEVMITLAAPVAAAPAIDGSTAAFEADHPDQGSLLDATGAFVDQHAGDFGTADEADLAAEAERGGEGWPLEEGETGPVDGAQGAASNDAAELEAGMSKAIAAAGLQPKTARRPRRAAGGAVE